jgi:hypothetical protein
MENTELIISINIHENINFLIKQLKNIHKYVTCNYIVIINANNAMYKIISNNASIKNNQNIVLNPISLSKRRFHGSLTKGIYSNIKFALSKYIFNHFIILSSRTFFYRMIDSNIIDNDNKNMSLHGTLYENINICEWHWKNFFKTKLAEYLKNNNLQFGRSMHEGLIFNHIVCQGIVEFIDNNNVIKNNLFTFNDCVEEFSLQSIALLYGGYVTTYSGIDQANKRCKNMDFPHDKYVYKLKRE